MLILGVGFPTGLYQPFDSVANVTAAPQDYRRLAQSMIPGQERSHYTWVELNLPTSWPSSSRLVSNIRYRYFVN